MKDEVEFKDLEKNAAEQCKKKIVRNVQRFCLGLSWSIFSPSVSLSRFLS